MMNPALLVLHSMLRVERFLNEDHNLRFFNDPAPTPPDAAAVNRDSIGPNFPLSPLVENITVEETTSYRRKVAVFLSFLLYMAAQGIYYLVHAFRTGEDHAVFSPTWILEGVNMAMIFTIPLCAPLHHSLGFANKQTPRTTLLARLSDLQKDKSTKKIIYLHIVLILFYTTGDACFWIPQIEGKYFQLFYVIPVLINISTIYFGILWATLVARVILTRIQVIEEEVDGAVDQYVTTNYDSLDEEDQSEEQRVKDQTKRWLQGYRTARYDFHRTSERFGWRFLFVLFLWIVETSSMILVLFEEMGRGFSILQFFLFTLAWGSNTVTILTVLFNMAYIPTTCIHHIGPKLSMLAMRHARCPEYSALASTFLLAPIRLHVGNFELGPEYANAISFWFISLFLLLFGLKSPGIE